MARDLGAIFTAAGITAAIHPLADTVQSDRWLARTASTIAGALGGFTLLLAAIGLFGVVSTIVTSRARELAVRMALGASRAALARLVARSSARLLILGLLLGSALAIPAARALASLLFGVEAFDASTWIAVPLVIALVVAAATLVPAARAMRTEPADLLREI
jgi:ABC-type antimicrobial peptide transport system permease subunit